MDTLYEKLGVSYLGRIWDPGAGKTRDELLLYDAKDLTTHAVIVGMTGSGKTGLGIGLLEEAAIDGVPAIVIDPKGDMGNLLLAFPDLAPGDFRPWIDEGEAARRGISPDEHAAATARAWREGLAAWGQPPERVARFRAAADTVIYTPGSTAGLPVSILRSFAAPAGGAADADALRERVAGTASGLLALLGREADPLQSRDHILLSNLLDRAWREGRDLDVAGLIRLVQTPGLATIGVLDLESFYPEKERFALVMALNNLLASPGFGPWTQGEPLDIPRLLWTPEGKPRIAILSIAHLSDPERMFFVTLLLNEIVAWMRTQAGTSSLRALLYMDEIFGYFPPSANPPSKLPMLTLLKQARAFGLGVALATQNPVDLDYKGLANTGTWFLGRLQTERDKARVLDGLEGATTASGGAFDRRAIEATLSGLASRVFLMNNVHEDAPVLFQTRWTMSYLRGPLTKVQIGALMAPLKEAPAPPPPPAPARAGAPPAPGSTPPGARPEIPPGVTEHFLPIPAELLGARGLEYRPALAGVARLHYVAAAAKLDAWETVALSAPLALSPAEDPWESAEPLAAGEGALGAEPAGEIPFAPIPAGAFTAKNLERWGKLLAGFLYRGRALSVWLAPGRKAASRPGESEGEFRARLALADREERDRLKDVLHARYAPKLDRLRQRIRAAEERAERERTQYDQQKVQSAISLGATVVGAIFGRKIASVGNLGRATTAARGVSRAAREREDVTRAEQSAEELRAELARMESSFAGDAGPVAPALDSAAPVLEPLEVRPRKTDIAVTRVALLWVPAIPRD